MASAQRMPKIVFAGTAIATMISVTRRAWRNAGLVSSVPDGAETVLEHPVEDHPDRNGEQEQRGSRAPRSRRP